MAVLPGLYKNACSDGIILNANISGCYILFFIDSSKTSKEIIRSRVFQFFSVGNHRAQTVARYVQRKILHGAHDGSEA